TAMLSAIHGNTVLASLNSRSKLPILPIAKKSLMLWDNHPSEFDDKKIPNLGDERLEVYEDPFRSSPPRPISQKTKVLLLGKRHLTAGFLTAHAFGRQDGIDSTTCSGPFGSKRGTMWGQRPSTPGYASSIGSDGSSVEWRD
ncbi:hypothetical protein H0H93_016989, partial [Arthromyces matolae]